MAEEAKTDMREVHEVSLQGVVKRLGLRRDWSRGEEPWRSGLWPRKEQRIGSHQSWWLVLGICVVGLDQRFLPPNFLIYGCKPHLGLINLSKFTLLEFIHFSPPLV